MELSHFHKKFTPNVKIFKLENESGSSLSVDTIKYKEPLTLFPQPLGSYNNTTTATVRRPDIILFYLPSLLW